MKLVHKDMDHILDFDGGYVNELAVENRSMFLGMVNSLLLQSEGSVGPWRLSISDKPVEISKYIDVSVQIAPFQINRKSLLTKMYAALEHRSLSADNYSATGELLSRIQKYVYELAEDFPFEIECHRLSMGGIIKALAPEIEEGDKSPLERIFAYMEFARELDRDRLFAMVNMRSYFSDDDMENFVTSVCLHDFKLLLLESRSESKLKNTRKYVIDSDLCEF